MISNVSDFVDLNHSTTVNNSHNTVKFDMDGGATRFIWTYISPVIYLIGIIGNITSICVLLRKNLRRLNITQYLLPLQVCDCLIITGHLLPKWIEVFFNFDYSKVPGFICKSAVYLGVVGGRASLWVLCALTVERLLFVYYPIKMRLILNKRITRGTIVATLLFFFLVAGHLPFGIGHAPHVALFQFFRGCGINDKEYFVFFMGIWRWVDAMFGFLLPGPILLGGNVAIVVKIACCRRAVAPVRNDSEANKNALTVLMMISVMFLVTTSPMVILFAGFAEWQAMAVANNRFDTLFLFRCVAKNFLYINHSSNFLIYCFGWPKFRAEIKRMFLCRSGHCQRAQ